ncbi:uncharacterized protein SPSK_06434 [Sporothrix schenckii 1099-18]|uniref:Aminoglycoside phosphotransferase domain-containing protein n=1 Tax=Sporothrix schenckii 1099-18 TaxID=1397361 RepID=A0A0F2MK95_SPOSC|nr:uncharacterized protein SPSK_06434 [Sporothrix schenckii 1099-18]KJR90032.1 hypothetical protein SPSK_06434 [Sporothrix schenckii 1099-18]
MPTEERLRVARKAEFETQSEIATMDFLRVDCAFSLLEYIHGNTAKDVSKSYPGDHEGIPPQFETKFWRQFAHTMIQLASIRMPKIASIVYDEKNTGSFTVGPFVETGTGPQESPAEFYSSYPLALHKQLGEATSGQKEAIDTVRRIASTLAAAQTDTHVGFGLVNYDLNANNVLVDRDFNIVAVIDWDSVISAPDAALNRFPFLMGIDPAVPGAVKSQLPAIVRRQDSARRFAAVVEEVGHEQPTILTTRGGMKHAAFTFTKQGFFTKEAVAVRSLTYVKMKQDCVNDQWRAGLDWLDGQDDNAVVDVYLRVA